MPAPADPTTTTKNAPQTPLHDGSNPGARTKLPDDDDDEKRHSNSHDGFILVLLTKAPAMN
jgi:hypothetical protein